jgi:Tfp pilus assembly protein PilZ
MEEKRRFPRVRLQSPLRYSILGRPETHTALANNVSLGGIGFTDGQYIPPSSTLQLEISLLASVLPVTGRVAWSAPLPHSDHYRLGVEFTNISEKDKVAIADYIDMQMAEA